MSSTNRQPWVVVVVADRLGAGYLGPYGNTWLETPAFNRLASQSLLLENMLTDSPQLESVYRSYWSGAHALHQTPPSRAAALPALVAAASRSAVLITDEVTVAEHPLEDGFGERIVVPVDTRDMACNDIAQTQLAEIFSAAIECLADGAPDLLWLHTQALQGAWDAPLSFRNQFADEEDPTPPEIVVPPALKLKRGFDPDEILGYSHAYAGQVTALDLCLETLLDVLDEHPRRDDLLLIVTSPRGFPMGEHLRVGAVDDALYGELLHVPALIRTAGLEASLLRDHALAQPADLYATILEWLNIPHQPTYWSQSWLPLLRQEPVATRPLSLAISNSQIAGRTAAWFLRRDIDAVELYSKPDDRWEVNDVADRCSEVIEPMTELMQTHQAAASLGQSPPTDPIAELLQIGLE